VAPLKEASVFATTFTGAGAWMRKGRAQGASAGEAGFSLVELLVSLALLSLLAALLASGLSLGQRVWLRSEDMAQASRVMFDAQSALIRLLQNLQPLHVDLQASRAIEFRGSADELEGVVPLPPHIGLGGLYRLHLFRNRSARHLDLTFRAYEQGTPPASGTSSGEAGLTTLAFDIDSLELRYFRKAKGDEAGGWASGWQGEEELPALISIGVKSAKAGVVWPELLIAPRVKPVDWR
jgi:general secretion pathway protein J